MKKPQRNPMSVPTKPQLLDLLDRLELTLSNMMRRWTNGILPEIRAEIMTEAYEPVLRMLIRAKRRREGGPPR